jgi:TonB family protein
MIYLTLLNFKANGQEDFQIAPPSNDEPWSNFVEEYTEDGIKYYIKIIPGDTTVGKKMPMYRPNNNELSPPEFIALDKLPIPIRQVQPELPLTNKNIQATVWIKCLVDKDGTVKKASVMRSDAELLNNACTAAALQWKFSPAEMKGKPITTWVAIPFKLKISR